MGNLDKSELRKRANEDRFERIRRVEASRREAQNLAPIVGRQVPPNADPGDDPITVAKKDPRVGEQDVPVNQRVDGYTAGMRHDQMQGVQSAAWLNDLDEQEALTENLANPINTANATNLQEEDFILDDDNAILPARTREEMDRGKESLERDMGAATARMAPSATRFMREEFTKLKEGEIPSPTVQNSSKVDESELKPPGEPVPEDKRTLGEAGVVAPAPTAPAPGTQTWTEDAPAPEPKAQVNDAPQPEPVPPQPPSPEQPPEQPSQEDQPPEGEEETPDFLKPNGEEEQQEGEEAEGEEQAEEPTTTRRTRSKK